VRIEIPSNCRVNISQQTHQYMVALEGSLEVA